MCAGVGPGLKKKECEKVNLHHVRLTLLVLAAYFHLVPHEQLDEYGVGTFRIPEHGVRSWLSPVTAGREIAEGCSAIVLFEARGGSNQRKAADRRGGSLSMTSLG